MNRCLPGIWWDIWMSAVAILDIKHKIRIYCPSLKERKIKICLNLACYNFFEHCQLSSVGYKCRPGGKRPLPADTACTKTSRLEASFKTRPSAHYNYLLSIHYCVAATSGIVGDIGDGGPDWAWHVPLRDTGGHEHSWHWPPTKTLILFPWPQAAGTRHPHNIT